MNARRTFLQKLGFGIALPGILGMDFKSHQKFRIDHSLLENEFWQLVRSSFPLSKNRVYFNNGTFGPAPFPVLQKLEEVNLNVSTTGEYGNSDQERKELANFLRISSEELSLTHNTTEGINIMAWGLPLKAGDEVILTSHDHAGNALPWLNRAKLHGITLKTFEPKNTQAENFDLIKSLCTAKTKVIAIPHVTCTTGLVFPIQEISEFARQKGIFTAIDGAHGAGTFDLNLEELGCDFYAGCFHKWVLGPSGTGFLYVRKDMLDQLQAIQIGGYSDSGWDMTINPPTLNGYVETAHRYDYGTQSKALFAGVVAATKFHEEIGRQKIQNRIQELSDRLYEGIKELSKTYDLLTPEESESRISMVTFRSKNMDSKELADAINREGFRVRLIHEAKLNAIRISTHIYNQEDEIDRFLEVIQES
ncbi:selenocysteine lyase/cysteine desulfurase [Algoriphagus boseongensis]|uniref:Selenocysteine lyase/cysteine desulfurase n=1 Tax=Algoriphagus boseongensis TaxID=1442587 RepID=A0A4R6TAC8_9BACT|nr:aminotransferase class V-fold PLP-dependent enzyme [Algoriphagus boseongensis]TDQ18424.1 selenocysteine lyase/cysteine desulfurase [Algoriphagus boseongensis]